MSALLSRHRPGSVLCFGGAGTRDAAQLSAHARAIASALPAHRPGAFVVLACEDRYHFAAALAACWMRGFSAALPANAQPATVSALSRRGTVLLHDGGLDGGLDVRALEDAGMRAALPLSLGLRAEDPALIAYTSGSTGEPVPHAKTLGQLTREPEAHLARFDLAGRRIVSAVSSFHIYGLLFGVLVPLLGGGSFCRRTPLQAQEILRELAEGEVLVAVPPHLRALAELSHVRLPALAAVFSSAAPLPAETSRALAARGLPVTEILGSTETGGIAYRDACVKPWRALPGVTISVAEDATMSLDSPWLAPDAPRPVPTRDRVELVSGGFRHLGRSDAVVKIGGRRIDLGELEARLAQQPGVREARVLAVPHPGVRGTELWAVIEADGGTPRSYRQALATHVDPVALPRRFRIVRSLPRSATGKLAQRDLLALFDRWQLPREQLADGVRFTVPRELGYFRGHFDGQPILPGVVQLHDVVLSELRRQHPDLGAVRRITRVKFKRLVSPGETLTLRNERKGARVTFTLDTEGQPAASGVFHFALTTEGAP